MFRSPYADALIALIIVLLFLGPKRLPGLGRSLGEGMREFKDGITGGSKNGSSERDRAAIPAAEAAPGQTQATQLAPGQPAATPPSPPPAAAPQPTPAGTNTPPPAEGAPPASGGQPASGSEASHPVVQPPPPAPAGTEVGSERRS